MSLQSLWDNIKRSKTFRPARFKIPATNIDPAILYPDSFKRHQQYFEVAVNEMYLSYERKWFTTWDPIVFAGCHFLYEGEMREVPFVVGPQMIKGKSEALPNGMVFENTKVAGLHPYRGGNFTISMVLGRMQKNNYLKSLISIMENTSGTYLNDFATAVVPYTKIAKVVISSLEDLFNTSDIEPMIGHRTTMNPDTMEAVQPGYFVLINKSEENVEEDKFYVLDNKLCYGDSKQAATPYRDNDYLLYSIMAAKYRNDIEALPYYEQFRKLQELISGMGVTIEDQERNLLNGRLFALIDTVRMSPDLIRDQVDEQIADFREQIKKMIDDRRPLAGAPGAKKDDRDDWEKKIDQELASILNNNL